MTDELTEIRARVDEIGEPSEVAHVDAPGTTCNDIDSAIRSTLAALKLCKKNENDFSDAVAMELSDVESQMECVRDANEKLRELGIESHELAKYLLNQRDEAAALCRRLLELLDEQATKRRTPLFQ